MPDDDREVEELEALVAELATNIERATEEARAQVAALQEENELERMWRYNVS